MGIQLLYWHWLVLGMLLVAGEIFIPSFNILWFGLGALLVGLLLLLERNGEQVQIYHSIVKLYLVRLLL